MENFYSPCIGLITLENILSIPFFTTIIACISLTIAWIKLKTRKKKEQIRLIEKTKKFFCNFRRAIEFDYRKKTQTLNNDSISKWIEIVEKNWEVIKAEPSILIQRWNLAKETTWAPLQKENIEKVIDLIKKAIKIFDQIDTCQKVQKSISLIDHKSETKINNLDPNRKKRIKDLQKTLNIILSYDKENSHKINNSTPLKIDKELCEKIIKKREYIRKNNNEQNVTYPNWTEILELKNKPEEFEDCLLVSKELNNILENAEKLLKDLLPKI